MTGKCGSIVSGVPDAILSHFGSLLIGEKSPKMNSVGSGRLCPKNASAVELPRGIGDVLRLMTLTGQRCSEVCGMRTDELRIGDKLWVLPRGKDRSKNDETHSVPLSARAWTIVEHAIENARDGYLFPARGADGPMSRHTPSHRFADVAKDLEIENFRLHDLRRAMKTYMRSLGVRADIADRVQGQISGLKRGVGWRYDHHEYLDEKRRALALWERRLLEIVEGRPASGERW